MTYAEQVELLGRVNEFERAGEHREAIRLCEDALDGNEIPEFNLALARNCYALAAKGNEIYAWPALLAALEGIAKRSEKQPDVVHAIGICRWVLGLFADPHRLDVRGFFHRQANFKPGNGGQQVQETPTSDIAAPPVADLEHIEQLLTSGHHVRCANALLTAAPPVIRYGRDSEWVSREARYLLATLRSSLAAGKTSALLAADDFPPPGDHDGQYYDRYLLTAAGIHREQLRARAARVPGIVISSLPKSASEFLSYMLAETLQAPVMRVTVGDPVLGTAHGKWVREIVRGGAVTHDHFAGSEANINALRDGGLSEIWVLVRDPRAAYWSAECMQTEYDGVSTATKMAQERVLRAVKIFGDWIGSWVRAKEAGFPVRFVFFRELTEKPVSVMGGILQATGAGRFIPKLREVLQRRIDQDQVSSNFRKGDDEAWRVGVPAEFHGAIWDAIDDLAKQLLDLKR